MVYEKKQFMEMTDDEIETNAPKFASSIYWTDVERHSYTITTVNASFLPNYWKITLLLLQCQVGK